MPSPPHPHDEARRQAVLARYHILDSENEQAYDDLVTIAARICDAPIAAISLIDEDRQWFKSRKGVEAQQTGRDISFCGHAILAPEEKTVVRDASTDARFLDNPLVTGALGVRFYAGAPLVTPDGQALGALARQVMYLLELRRISSALATQMAERDWYEQQLRQYQDELEVQNADLAAQTRTDPLTGLPNRRALTMALDMALEQHAAGRGKGVSVAVVDVDHFKVINDVHGHATGDEVLVALADTLRAHSADGMAARYGGEEFVILFPDSTGEQARAQCEFLRTAATSLPVDLAVTVSIGVAECRRRDDTAEDAFRRADQALYAAKRGGRDRVVLAP
ncbi:sensor domain-containing diguanylate cyclase [Pseudoxanthomonas winnipegensis]|jgi:diguanylate cyclase (GGDEF)-like protein|uniref:diguanylate cyclase n=1 Tax=Pseudoxanthomonas winnipegensis TaxID=2480810 RepID=A0ABY1WHA4_9GAMM|nr:sensor domain-containing diguanylate cyclase [Pseudoxanthomonas winnipegensis]TAA10773.1 sensor domain-containing diguanylate cyclase [Pseudoxanthomonas winnipegensis]TAA22073.1 sensor domain-containing diguanylate cyclase [Pseudoxanthomonas winnipegensis]TAH74425.1 sensor domain-containing diguanylate cyclase [Pseudoxanthomonas winnipegensis]